MSRASKWRDDELGDADFPLWYLQENQRMQRDEGRSFNEMQQRFIPRLHARIKWVLHSASNARPVIICQANCGGGKTLVTLMVLPCLEALCRTARDERNERTRCVLSFLLDHGTSYKVTKDVENSLFASLNLDRDVRLETENRPYVSLQQFLATVEGALSTRPGGDVRRVVRESGLLDLLRGQMRRQLETWFRGAEVQALDDGPDDADEDWEEMVEAPEASTPLRQPEPWKPWLVVFLYPQTSLGQQALKEALRLRALWDTVAPPKLLVADSIRKGVPDLWMQTGKTKPRRVNGEADLADRRARFAVKPSPSPPMSDCFKKPSELSQEEQQQMGRHTMTTLNWKEDQLSSWQGNACIFTTLQQCGKMEKAFREAKLSDKYNIVVVIDELQRVINVRKDDNEFKKCLHIDAVLILGMTATHLGTKEALMQYEGLYNIKEESIYHFRFSKYESIRAGMTVPTVGLQQLEVKCLSGEAMQQLLNSSMDGVEKLYKVHEYKDKTLEEWQKKMGKRSFCLFYCSLASALVYSLVIEDLRLSHGWGKLRLSNLSPWQNTLVLSRDYRGVVLSLFLLLQIRSRAEEFVLAQWDIITALRSSLERRARKELQELSALVEHNLPTLTPPPPMQQTFVDRLRHLHLVIPSSMQVAGRETGTSEEDIVASTSAEEAEQVTDVESELEPVKRNKDDIARTAVAEALGLEHAALQEVAPKKMQVECLSAGEIAAKFRRRCATKLHMVFGTYDGLATGIDCKAMDALVSNTDPPSITGWQAIQAIGRLERVDAERLKTRAYALSTTPQVQPSNELKEQIFNEGDTELDGDRLSVEAGDWEDELREERETCSAHPNTEWTDDSKILILRMPVDFFTAHASSQSKAPDEPYSNGFAIGRWKENGYVEGFVRSNHGKSMFDGGAAVPGLQITKQICSRLERSSLPKMGQRGKLLDLRSVVTEEDCLVFGITRTPVQSIGRASGTAFVLSQMGAVEQGGARCAAFQPIYASREPEKIKDAVVALLHDSDSERPFPAFSGEETTWRVKSRKLMHADGTYVSFDYQKPQKGRNNFRRHMGMLEPEGQSRWNLKCCLVKHESMDPMETWKSPLEELRKRQLPPVSLHFGPSLQKLQDMPLEVVSGGGCKSVSLVGNKLQNENYHGKSIFVFLPIARARRLQDWKFDKVMAQEALRTLRPSDSQLISDLDLRELKPPSTKFYLAMSSSWLWEKRCHVFIHPVPQSDGVRISYVKSTSLQRCSRMVPWRVEEVDGESTFFLKAELEGKTYYWKKPLEVITRGNQRLELTEQPSEAAHFFLSQRVQKPHLIIKDDSGLRFVGIRKYYADGVGCAYIPVSSQEVNKTSLQMVSAPETVREDAWPWSSEGAQPQPQATAKAAKATNAKADTARKRKSSSAPARSKRARMEHQDQ